MKHYERTNRAAGKDRDAVMKLLKIREAMESKNANRPEIALDVNHSRFPRLLSLCCLFR